MDKYEFNIKIEKMKKAVDRKDYVTAAKVADSINWERSTNAKVLMMIAQIYEKLERYTDARNALTEVYNRVPVGKRIVYKLTELAVKCNDIDDALDLYREYQELAPNDPSKLILAYKISTARGDDLEKRIAILEAYRRRDFEEKWAYELATLYQQAGRGADCVAICDEIILWFGVGPYVDRAMTLKVAYAPLTPEQEEKRAHKDYYEQKLAEVAAMSAVVPVSHTSASADTDDTYETDDQKTGAPTDEAVDASDSDASEYPAHSTSEFPSDAPGVSPVVKEAELHMTMQQELAQAIQSTTEDFTPEEDTNEWVTDKPLSVDRVGEDIDGQYTLFRTVAEENDEIRGLGHTRTFSFGALLTKTRRLDSLRDLAELNGALVAENLPVEEATVEPAVEKAPVVEPAVAETTIGETAVAEETATVEDDKAVEETATADETAVADTAAAETEVGGEPEIPAVPVIQPETVMSPADEPQAAETPAPEKIEAAEIPDIHEKNHNMIFCHVLKLNDDTPAVAQIKEAFRQAHEVSGIPAASIARVSVEKINRAGFTVALKKLQGRDLLLEQAGDLTQTVIDQLLDAVEDSPCTAVILLADDGEGIAELYRKAPALFPLSAEALTEETAEDAASDPDNDLFEGFASFVPKEFDQPSSDVAADTDIDGIAAEPVESDDPGDSTASSAETDSTPVDPGQLLDPDSFAAFIHKYALENDCKFDSMAELALAARIDRMELSGEPMTAESATELVENAIDKAERFTFKSIFVSRYDKEGYLILKENHFS